VSPLSRHRHVLVIFNPAAGPRRRRTLKRVLAELRQLGCAVTLRATEARGDAEAIARAADPNTFDLVAVAGGDGTINEVINGLVDRHMPLALIPLGTANVLANEIGLRGDARMVARSIAEGVPRQIYLGQANGRRFAMMLGIGIDARIVEGIDPRLKRIAGKFAYVVSGVLAVLRYRPVHYRISIDGTPYTGASAIIANGRFYGGRFVLARGARLDISSLHVVLLERPGRWNVLRYGLAIALQRIHRLADVRIVEARAVTIDGPIGELAQVDGDLDGTLPLAIGLAREPLLLIGG
jgi:diacylglycerol kinase (ATP)